jgi:hypothetical protein
MIPLANQAIWLLIRGGAFRTRASSRPFGTYPASRSRPNSQRCHASLRGSRMAGVSCPMVCPASALQSLGHRTARGLDDDALVATRGAEPDLSVAGGLSISASLICGFADNDMAW